MHAISLAAGALSAAVAIGIAGWLVATVGITTASVLATVLAIGGVLGLATQVDAIDRLKLSAGVASKVAQALERIEFPPELTKLSRAGTFAGGFAAISERIARDPPRDDYLVSEIVPTLSDFPATLYGSSSTALFIACQDKAIISLERYQGALNASDWEAASARLSEYQGFEACFLSSATAAGVDLVRLFSETGLPSVMPTETLRSALLGVDEDTFTSDERELLQSVAALLGMTPNDLIELVRQSIEEAPSVLDLDARVTDLAHLYSDVPKQWDLVVPAQVSEVGTLFLILLGLSCAFIKRRGGVLSLGNA